MKPHYYLFIIDIFCSRANPVSRASSDRILPFTSLVLPSSSKCCASLWADAACVLFESDENLQRETRAVVSSDCLTREERDRPFKDIMGFFCGCRES